MITTVELPIRTISEANRSRHEHWSTTAKRVKGQRAAARGLTRIAIANKEPLLSITLTRIAPRQLDQGNLGRALKAVQDGVSDALRIDDGSPAILWIYSQRKGRSNEYSVLVEIDQKGGR